MCLDANRLFYCAHCRGGMMDVVTGVHRIKPEIHRKEKQGLMGKGCADHTGVMI